MTPPAGRLRRVFSAFPSGVTAVSALIDGRPVGIAASSFTSVSLDPPLVSVCIAHSSTTWPAQFARSPAPLTAAMKPSGSTRLMVSDLTFILRNSVLGCLGG
jgi:hypothetical protein